MLRLHPYYHPVGAHEVVHRGPLLQELRVRCHIKSQVVQSPFVQSISHQIPHSERCSHRDGTFCHNKQGNRHVIGDRSEEHTSELQSRPHLVCRLLLEKKKKQHHQHHNRKTT